jgi:zinc transport system substrate-binding protein
MFMKTLYLPTIVFCLCSVLTIPSCQKRTEKTQGPEIKKINVVTSLFPIYEFVRNVAGDKTETVLLLPPGVEPHSFEPRPGDILTINRADLLFYTNDYMEPWISTIMKGIKNQNLIVINTGKNIPLIGESDLYRNSDNTGKEGHGDTGKDPHIWLNFANAITMVEKIRDGLAAKDPVHADYYTKNASDYTERLRLLDRRYKDAISGCRTRIIVNGGHFTFGYLAERYNLRYISAYGLSPNSEPSPGSLVKVSDTLKNNGLKHIFFEELITPRIAETIARETGAELLMLHGAHNISKDEFSRGVTFLSLMENNLEHIITGLQCRQK